MLEKLLPFLLVASGGAFGAMARYALGSWIQNRYGTSFPIHTFVINVTGSFILGMVATMASENLVRNPREFQLLVGVGFLGAYTTFSTFELETSGLLGKGEFLMSTLYVVGSVVVGFVGVRLGIIAARLLA